MVVIMLWVTVFQVVGGQQQGMLPHA